MQIAAIAVRRWLRLEKSVGRVAAAVAVVVGCVVAVVAVAAVASLLENGQRALGFVNHAKNAIQHHMDVFPFVLCVVGSVGRVVVMLGRGRGGGGGVASDDVTGTRG